MCYNVQRDGKDSKETASRDKVSSHDILNIRLINCCLKFASEVRWFRRQQAKYAQVVYFIVTFVTESAMTKQSQLHTYYIETTTLTYQTKYWLQNNYN